MLMDFSKYKKTSTFFGGSEKKFGIMIGDNEYMLKFQKITNSGEKMLNHISEYIGSHIFEFLGFKVHETYLGLYKNNEVVACKNFIKANYQFVPFSEVGESTLEESKDKYSYSYSDIMAMLKKNTKLTNLPNTIDVFWDMFVVDAIIGNFDRHGSNWGFLKKDNKYEFAPIFDNGSCLFPRLINKKQIDFILDNKEELEKRIYIFPTSQIKIGSNKSSYYDVISSMRYSECYEAVKRIYKRYNKEVINKIIDNTPMIDECHKRFYKIIINERFNKIIKETYVKLESR